MKLKIVRRNSREILCDRILHMIKFQMHQHNEGWKKWDLNLDRSKLHL